MYSGGWGNEDWSEQDSDWSADDTQTDSAAPEESVNVDAPLSDYEVQLLKQWYKHGHVAVSPAGDLVVVGT
ncbi:hypothetical protein SARC_15904, partial [Sphaeroforma arctica JP610]